MTSVSELYDLWLKPWHLPVGKTITVTIKTAQVKELHPRPTQPERKIVLSFVGKSRRLILNQTQANAMSDLGGEDWTGWAGLVISIKREQYTSDKETIHILPATNGNGRDK